MEAMIEVDDQEDDHEDLARLSLVTPARQIPIVL